MELKWLRHLADTLPGQTPTIPLGVGDDAALVDFQGPAVVAADMILDGAHFELEHCGAELAGRKALAVNFSDLAAMGAWPVAVFLSLALPRDSAERIAHQVLAGVQSLASEYDALIAGGDTNVWDGKLAIAVTVIGRAAGPAWLRRGARPGDLLVVSGPLGGSLRERHLRFTPRLKLARRLQQLGVVQAAIDLSDGLALDLSRITTASGCGAVLDADRIPLSPDAKWMAEHGSGRTPLEHALHDGEDFELLLAVAPSDLPRAQAAIEQEFGRLYEVGCCTEAADLLLRDPRGASPLTIRGYEHGGDSHAPVNATANAAYVVLCQRPLDTERLAEWLDHALPPACVVALNGELGAGKTYFVRALAAASGVDPAVVVSPTFLLSQSFAGRRKFHHLDVYRLGDEDEFLELGVEELFEDQAITLIEWGGRMASCLPLDRLDIEIEILGVNSRRFHLQPRGEFRWAAHEPPPLQADGA